MTRVVKLQRFPPRRRTRKHDLPKRNKRIQASLLLVRMMLSRISDSLSAALLLHPLGILLMVCARDFLKQSISDSNESGCWSSTTLVEVAKTRLSKMWWKTRAGAATTRRTMDTNETIKSYRHGSVDKWYIFLAKVVGKVLWTLLTADGTVKSDPAILLFFSLLFLFDW